MILARDPMDELKRAFKLFAPEGKRITVEHLAKVAQDLGENLDHEELCVRCSLVLWRLGELTTAVRLAGRP